MEGSRNSTQIRYAVGRRIGQLLRQYSMRIAYANGKIALYEEEQKVNSAMGKVKLSLQAAVAANCWKVYSDNLTDKKEELENAVTDTITGYSQTEKRIWWMFFIDGMSSIDIAKDGSVPLCDRQIRKIVNRMSDEMGMRFNDIPRQGATKCTYSAEQVARYLDENPDESYIQAIEDLMKYGFLDLDCIESDEQLRDFVESGRREGDGEEEEQAEKAKETESHR